MFKKIIFLLAAVLFVVSVCYADGERIIPDGKLSIDSFTSPDDAIFDRAHMCSASVSDADCAIPEAYTIEQPKFHLRFWAPDSQNYNRHYLITDSAGTLVYYALFNSFIFFGWNTITYEPSNAFFGNGDYNFYVIYQGTTTGGAALKSSFFAVR